MAELTLEEALAVVRRGKRRVDALVVVEPFLGPLFEAAEEELVDLIETNAMAPGLVSLGPHRLLQAMVDFARGWR